MKTRILLIILIFSIVPSGLGILSLLENEILNDIRSYVRGESLYSRGHKNAINSLVKYTSTRESVDFERFLKEIDIPLGDKIAREALQKEDPDKELAYKGFLQAENHPDDIKGMIFFFLAFEKFYYVEESIKHWENADQANMAIYDLGLEINEIVKANPQQDLQLYINKIYMLAESAEYSQESFSSVLSDGARWVKNILSLTTIGTFFFLIFIALFLTRKLFQDIHLHNKMLKESHKLAKIGSWKIYLNKKEIDVSEEFKELYDVKSLPFTFEDLLQTIHTEDRERVAEILTNVFQNPYEGSTEYKIKTNGTIKNLAVSWNLLYDSNGHTTGFIGYSQDITEQKLLQEELLQSKEMFEKLFKDSPAAYFIISAHDGKIKRCNRSAEELLRAEESQIIGLNPADLSPEYQPNGLKSSEGVAPKISMLKEKGKIQFEWVHKRLDGTEFWSDVLLSMTVIDGEEVVLSLWEDISEAKKLQQELKIAKHAAEQASQAKSDFLANMSHEIRTPMTGLLGFIEALQKTEDDPQKIKQFKIVQNSGNTLLNIINDILDFSKIESGKMELDCTPIPLLENLYNSIENFSTLADSKNINLLSVIDENVPECIMGDITRIKQVLFNLISNAIKFTNESGTITLKAYFDVQTNLLHIEVLDTGIGISPHNLQKIFESFSQEDISTTRKFGGTGLGLSISAKLVQLMGGTLEVNSKVGEGSRFYFEIPIQICDKQDLAHIESETDIGTHIQTLRGDILIVEDNKTNQMLMGMILDDLELSYDIANNGEEALTLVNQKRYDLIFMDENMPIMNGIEATKIIRANESEANLHTPIIAVTANALIEDREKFLKAGMDDYISKPYTQDQIIATLQKFLDKKTEV